MDKDPDIIPEGASLITLDSKYSACMAKNSKYTKHTSHISRRLYSVRNGENLQNTQYWLALRRSAIGRHCN